jgi:hypothetical protein
VLARSIRNSGAVMKWVPAEGACVAVTGIEPFEKAVVVKFVMTSGALPVRKSLLRRDNRIADGTFLMSLESASNILSERFQAIDDRTVLGKWLVTK